MGDELDELEAAALRSAQEEKRLGSNAQKRGAKQMLLGVGKKPRVGEISSAPPPPATPSAGGQWLDELQARQLSRTAAEFPDLFTDVLPANFVAAAGGQQKSVVSVGKFAKRGVKRGAAKE